jgi:hypothetical protein
MLARYALGAVSSEVRSSAKTHVVHILQLHPKILFTLNWVPITNNYPKK